MRRQRYRPQASPTPAEIDMQEYVFAGVRAERNFPDLLGLISDWQPDITCQGEDAASPGYIPPISP